MRENVVSTRREGKSMNVFSYINQHLNCERVDLHSLASTVGTPFFVYSYTYIIQTFTHIAKCFSTVEPLIAYSVKSNSNMAIIAGLAQSGAGFDVVSGGELVRVMQAGGRPEKIIFAGVGKTAEEIELALKNNILMFNVESLPESYLIDEIGHVVGKKARVALRINPDVDPHTHEYITTGKLENKFGIPWDMSEDVAREIAGLRQLNLVGLHVHIGSQITDPEVHIKAAERLRSLIASLRSYGIEIEYLNIGGGYGIRYKEEETPFKIENLAVRIIPLVKEIGCRLILEPGRYIVGPAGALIVKILYIKLGKEKTFVIVDGSMTELIRPALYGAYHRIVPVQKKDSSEPLMNNVDVVGPVCESSDFLAKKRSFHGLKQGDLMCVLDTGAYGAVMTSQYNSRPRPPEILIKDDEWFLVKERESLKDLTRLERLPDFLKKS